MRYILLVFIILFLGCSDSDPDYDQQLIQEQQDQYKAYLDKYDEQNQRADMQLDRAEKHMVRYEILLKRWEEQADRYDRILEKWESQTVPGRN